MIERQPAAEHRAERWRSKNFLPYEHVVSVSGGKDSTALYLAALERGMPFTAVFCDTGNEHEATYEAVRRLPEVTGGPPIVWVKADFSHRFEKRREWIAAKWPEKGVPADKIERALKVMHSTGNPFLDLCILKGRFPGSKSRFCTEFLKVLPIFQKVNLPLFEDGKAVISWQGVRKQESFARSLLPKWQRLNAEAIGPLTAEQKKKAGGWRLYAYRPLIEWTVEDVFAFHKRHGVEANPLYSQGMNRVGCMPCIMCGKDELREIAARFPEHIDRLEEWERLASEASKRGCATFFAIGDDPLYSKDATELSRDQRFSPDLHGIRNRVAWSKTDRGGKQPNLFKAADFGTACNQWGVCE